MARTLSPSADLASLTWLSPEDFHAKAVAGTLPERVAIRQTFTAEIKAMPPDGDMPMRKMAFVISTVNADRDRDVIQPGGVKLDAYLKNPVVLWSHDYYSPPIGRALSIANDGTRLIAEAEFADAETYPFADTIYRLLQKGFLRACSIGFRPVTYKRNDERGGYDFEECELLEFSVVAVPANAEALALAASADGPSVDLAPIEAWIKSVREAQEPELVIPSIPSITTITTTGTTASMSISPFTGSSVHITTADLDAAIESVRREFSKTDEPMFRLLMDAPPEPEPVLFQLVDDEPTYQIDDAQLKAMVAQVVAGAVALPVERAVERAFAEARGRVV